MVLCSIRDIVERRSVNPPIMLRSVRRGYTLHVDEDNCLRASYSDQISEGKNLICKSNEILIDALEAGERLENGCHAEEVFSEWIEKYGFTPSITDEKGFETYIPNGTINIIIYVYTQFCMFLKAKFGYDVFHNSTVEKSTPARCAEEFRLDTISRRRIVFDGCIIKVDNGEARLYDLLINMLADFVTTDNGWQQFACNICGKISIRKNPKKCYCSECTKKRYQVSRQKKKLEGGKPNGKT